MLTVLAPGGVAAALTAGVFAWLRGSPARDATVKIRRADGASVFITAPLARDVTPQDLPDLVDAVSRWMDEDAPAPDAVRPPDGESD